MADKIKAKFLFKDGNIITREVDRLYETQELCELQPGCRKSMRYTFQLRELVPDPVGPIKRRFVYVETDRREM